jgi:integrase
LREDRGAPPSLYPEDQKGPPLLFALPQGFAGRESPFLTEKGEALTIDALRHVFNALKRRAGIKRLYPYFMRHTSATSYLQNGADLETMKPLLGHTSYAVTQRYLSLTQGDLGRAQRKASMVKKLREKEKKCGAIRALNCQSDG